MKKILFTFLSMMVLTSLLYPLTLKECNKIANMGIDKKKLTNKTPYKIASFIEDRRGNNLDTAFYEIKLNKTFGVYDAKLFYMTKSGIYNIYICTTVVEQGSKADYVKVITNKKNIVMAIIAYRFDDDLEGFREHYDWNKKDFGPSIEYKKTGMVYWKKNDVIEFMGLWGANKKYYYSGISVSK